MIPAIQHTRPSGARRATVLVLAAGAVVLAAGSAFAQGTAGGVAQDPTVLAQNFLTWFQPLATVAVGAIVAGLCVGAAGNPRQIGGVAGAGVFAIGLIWGFPYIPTAMGVLGSTLRG